MTSIPNTSWKKSNFVIFFPATALSELQEVYDLMVSYGISPKEYVMGDTYRSFLSASGIDTTKVQVFKSGTYIGDPLITKRYLEILMPDEEQYTFDY